MFISQKEYDKFLERLLGLKKRRTEILKGMGEVMKESGSFPHNTPGYAALDEERKVLENQITKIRKKINSATVISDISGLPHEVSLYSVVTVENLDTKEISSYYIKHIVDEGEEAAILITPDSPIAKALIGKKRGDLVEVELGRRKTRLKIIKHEHRL